VVNNSHEAAVNNASEKIFCTLMRNSDVDLNFANKEGHTPLDLAFLSLHPKVISMKVCYYH
jgi:ankyrin repeat protein